MMRGQATDSQCGLCRGGTAEQAHRLALARGIEDRRREEKAGDVGACLQVRAHVGEVDEQVSQGGRTLASLPRKQEGNEWRFRR